MGALFGLVEKLFEAARSLPAVRRDMKRKGTLRKLLDDPKFRWRSITTLARSIGASEDATRELLVSIGARASVGQGEEMWGLRSRVDAAEDAGEAREG
jgi:hypothetical protein